MKVIKKSYYKYGNWDYRELKHYETYLVEQRDGYRLTQKKFEYLQEEFGYEPAPETAVTRKLQKKYLFFWKTIKEYTYRRDVNQEIKEACFGTRFDDSKIWKEKGLLTLTFY